MREIISLLICCLSFTASFGQIKVYEKFDELEAEFLLNLSEDTTYVVNFWATWCGPCVKELPYFEELLNKHKDGPFQQVLVSLDSPKKADTKVADFIHKNNIKSKVVLLADGKANNWIDRIDPSWSGAIPITLILKGNQKLFFEREFHSMEEIEEQMNKILNN